MERCCYLRNVHDKMADDKTAFEKRYGQKFDGPTEDSWSMRGEPICRHHEEPRLMLYDQDNETTPDPIEIRQRDETNSDEY